MELPSQVLPGSIIHRDAVSLAVALAEKSKARKRIAPAETQATKIVAQLPLWPDVVRGVPNIALRSALFGAIKKGVRPYWERQKIQAQDGIDIIYTGARLNQGDLDVWEAVLHVAREQVLGDECRVTAYHLLMMLGKTDTGKNRVILNRSLSRMNATAVNVVVGKFSYEGSLINEVYRSEVSREYILRLNPKLRVLFEAGQFTQIDWNIRHALDGQPLAQWLHGYYASHAKPFALNEDTLLRLSGSENTEPRSGRQKLRKALDALACASTTNGQPFSYNISNGLVRIKKKPSATQRRHLMKKSGKLKLPILTAA